MSYLLPSIQEFDIRMYKEVIILICETSYCMETFWSPTTLLSEESSGCNEVLQF